MSFMTTRATTPAADWKFDFSVEEDEDGDFIVQDAYGIFVCQCDTEDNALSIAGALNQTWMGHELLAAVAEDAAEDA